MTVFKPVSSRKTNRRTSQPGCWHRHRFRAALTSGRSCSAARVVFFIAQAQFLQPVPQGGQTDNHLKLLPATLLQLTQRQIRLHPKPTAQSPVVLLQTRTPIAPNLFGLALPGQTVLVPKPLDTLSADPETPANLAGACSALSRGDDALTQILA